MAQVLVGHMIAHVRRWVHQNTGRRPARVDILQERVGRMQTRVDAAREPLCSEVDHAARVDDIGRSLVPLLQTKAAVAASCTEVAREALDACGTVAYGGHRGRALLPGRGGRADHGPDRGLMQHPRRQALIGEAFFG